MKNIKNHPYLLLSLGVIILAIACLVYLGQPLYASTGKIYLWSSAGGADYSQHISDWYSFSHFLHGIVFFLGIVYFFKKMSYEKVFFIAVLIESVWEVVENSPIIIDRYRQSGIAAGYFGDSVLNSFFDIMFMILGFLFVKKFGAKVSLILFLVIELFTLYIIRDGLTLNVIMLLHPFEFISNWQKGV